jgi:nucleoid DNA-binding protein
MFLENIIIQKIPLLLFEFAQIQSETAIESAEEASFVFSGPQFFTALIAGVVLAFAFQLLFTNLGVAVGISLAGGSSSNDQGESSSFGGTVKKIGLAVGLGTLISVMVSLFVASFLAVKLSLFVSPALGAIIGLVIWATYFTLLVWVSSSTVGSLVGSVVNTATSGFQAIWGTAAAMVGSQAMSKQVVNTAEAAAAAVRRELGSAIDPETIKENLQDYVERLRPPELNWQGIRSDFEKLLNTSEFDQVVASGDVPNLDRQTFATLISDRTDLSKRDAEKLAAQLEDAWKQKVGQHKPKNTITSLVDYLKSAAPEELVGGQFGDKIDSIIAQMGKGKGNQSQQPGAMSQALTFSLNSLMGLVLGRTDLSELDAEKVITQLQKLKGYAGEQKDKLVAQVNQKENYSPIRADLENYLLNAYSWQFKPATLKREVQELIYDSDANPEMMAAELEGLNRGDFVNWLQQKGLHTQDEIESTATLLENVRLDTMAATQAAIERAKTITLLADVEHYLLNTPAAELVPEKIQLNFKPILEDSSVDSDRLIKRLSQLDHLTYKDILEMRADLAAEDIAIIIPYLESVQKQVIKESQDAGEAAKAKTEQQWLKVQSYLRDTHKEQLNPDAIKREIQLLLDDPQAGAHALGARVSRFDRDTLVQLLSQRQDLSEEQVNQTIDQIENTWKSVRYAPQQLAGKAKEQYDQAVGSITNYLRSTGKEELNPEGIQRDLKKLLDDPSEGAKSIRSRLARMDRDTLVKLLSQREDLSEEQVNHIIDNVQGTLQDLAKAPRRLARRTQQKVQDFQSTIADYLRSTDKEEFNPEGIKRDVQLLLNDPRAGVESLQDRLSKIDRESLIALLSQREDISSEDAKRIVDQILVVRERTIEQLQSIQKQLQSAVDSLLNRIRDYLNGLERPELNYDGIKTDLRTMLDDPQAGFDALRDRFSQLDRNTLIAVISSRDDISQADAERLVNQVERTRDRMLQRAERLQRETQYRLEKVKEDAQKQIEETRKAAATASWWLFFTALFSALASAGAGALGVIS